VIVTATNTGRNRDRQAYIGRQKHTYLDRQMKQTENETQSYRHRGQHKQRRQKRRVYSFNSSKKNKL